MRHSRASDVEEALLTELMMTPGLDATLVGSLDGVQLDSTDYLCLSSFSQNLALVASLDVAEVARHWERLGLDGHIVPVGHANGTPGRRVYYLPLELGTASILAHLKQLLIDRTVQTVSLLLPVMAKPQPTVDKPAVDKPAVESIGPLPTSLSKLNSSTVAAAQGAIPTVLPADQKALTRTAVELELEAAEPQWPDLDRLVDDFDALDL